ncbi:hypothetical protein E2P71_03785, partial [Candidatus Bathyarchaeota archaeon]
MDLPAHVPVPSRQGSSQRIWSRYPRRPPREHNRWARFTQLFSFPRAFNVYPESREKNINSNIPHRLTMYDLIIKNGKIISGAGNPWFKADIGVKEGVITEIGKIQGEAETVINAKGLAVSPGVIDL